MDKLDIETYKSQFINLLKSTGREGVDDLIEMLDEGKMHFFTAPASVNHHLNSDGGLLLHSLNTCRAALKLREMVIGMRPELEEQLNRDSVIIASLLHDICKADIYVPAIKKQRGADGIWREVESYDINYSNFPMGHGEKSAMLALMGGLE
ncbi:MAG: TraI domain-containing protein, partial [Muribaculaceae bacterium]|nr:TraI domain-containing protein [Muribaculaceae bacterium]